VIRFSASLVVVGVGLLIAGGVTSKLLLIYIAIGVSALALLFLILGAIVHRAELFGREPEGIEAGQATRDGYADELAAQPEPAATAVAAGPAAASPDRAEPARRGSADLSPAQQAFAGYEEFTRQAARRHPEPARDDRPPRPSQPQAKPFVDPQPTRMDWAADLREAEKQERERQGQAERSERSERQTRPGQSQPDRSQPDRGQPGKPFVDPQPTRMDWAAGLREAEKQELGQPSRTGDRETSGRESSSPSRPQRAPEPAPAQATRAERIQPPQPAEATRAEKIQTPRAQPGPAPATAAEPAPAQATRAEKIITAEPGDRGGAGVDQPAETGAATPENTAKAGDQPAADQLEDKPATSADGDAQEPAEAPEDSNDPAAERDTGQPDSGTAGADQTAADQPSAAPAAASAATTGAAGDGQAPDGEAGTEDEDVTVVPGVPRYHRSECILIRFMGDNDLQRMPVEQARKAGCTPCRACQPDGEEDD
jgi:hypothetical protein